MHGDISSGTTSRCSDSNNDFEYGVAPYKNPDELRRLYHDEGLSQGQIADRFDVSQPTICYWFGEMGIESRPPMNERSKSISRSVREDGKTQFHVPDGDGGQFRFYRHQLVALLAEDEDGSWHCENPFDLISEEKNEVVVHHCMNSPVAVDLPENLELMSQEEHVRGHAGGAIVQHPEVVLREIFDEENPLSEERKRAAKVRQWKSRFDNSTGAVAGD